MHDRPFGAYLADYWVILLPCILTIPAALLLARQELRRTVLILGVTYGALHYGLQGKGWLYQLYPFIGFSSALLACSVGYAMRSASRQRALSASALAIYHMAAFGLWDGRLRPAMALTAARTETVALLRQDLAPRLGPNVTVQTFDTTGGCVHALFRVNAALPTEFLSDFLLFIPTNDDYVANLRAQLIRELKSRPPAYLVVYRWGWLSGQYDRLDRFPGLHRFIRDNYAIEISRPQYRVYGLRVRR